MHLKIICLFFVEYSLLAVT